MLTPKLILRNIFVIALILVINQNSPAQITGNGFEISNLDRSADACTDFNGFANGGWLAKNPVPPAFAAWSNFHLVIERDNKILREILDESAGKKFPAGSNEQKLGDFYQTCINEKQIEYQGLKPIEPVVRAINAIKNARDLIPMTAYLHNIGTSAMFGSGAIPDPKDSRQIIALAVQAGLSLYNRDNYLKQDDKSKEIRSAYLKYLAQMFELSGDSTEKAGANAEAVMNIETKLAEASMDNIQRRDPNATYNKMTIAELKRLTPNIDWEFYFRERGATSALKEVNIAQPEFFKSLDRLLTTISLADWKTYFRWNLINGNAAFLSSKFENANFEFYGRYLSGKKERLPRIERCVSETDTNLGELLGQEFVKRAYPPKAKARISEMIDNLLFTLRQNLASSNWLSETTRQEALAKLNSMKRQIGYPDDWHNYSALKIKHDSYFDNSARVAKFESQRVFNTIGKPVDTNYRFWTPQEVNAYYGAYNNQIVFPAGILQPPFFNFTADNAVNYGAIGSIIGHEIFHGFDNKGRKYDSKGNLRDWWLPEDAKNYEERAACVEQQFSSFKVANDLTVNGKQVLAEAIADLGGLRLAYEAFEKSMEWKPRPAAIDGFTPEQRFFLGYAQAKAENDRPETVRKIIETDEHPLSRYRINAPLANMPEFAEAFGCKIGDAMARAEKERCRIW